MSDEQVKPVRKRGRKKRDDLQADLHRRLDRFIENATNPATLDSLVSGLVDYELGVRLARLDESGNE